MVPFHFVLYRVHYLLFASSSPVYDIIRSHFKHSNCKPSEVTTLLLQIPIYACICFSFCHVGDVNQKLHSVNKTDFLSHAFVIYFDPRNKRSLKCIIYNIYMFEPLKQMSSGSENIQSIIHTFHRIVYFTRITETDART